MQVVVVVFEAWDAQQSQVEECVAPRLLSRSLVHSLSSELGVPSRPGSRLGLRRSSSNQIRQAAASPAMDIDVRSFSFAIKTIPIVSLAFDARSHPNRSNGPSEASIYCRRRQPGWSCSGIFIESCGTLRPRY